MAQSTTPRKTCVLGNVCIICGFSFVVLHKTSDGKEEEHKYFDNKLRLNQERLQNIKKVTEHDLCFEMENSNLGVCRKCYRAVESVIKSEEKNKLTKQSLRNNLEMVYKTQILNLPSPRRKVISKRMLRSPDVSIRPSKALASATYVSPVKILPFKDLSNLAVYPNPSYQEVINSMYNSRYNDPRNKSDTFIL